jgi:hypothetical protein
VKRGVHPPDTVGRRSRRAEDVASFKSNLAPDLSRPVHSPFHNICSIRAIGTK